MNSKPSDSPQSTRVSGIVKWFNEAKGFGFITPDNGGRDLFCHYTTIQGSGFKTLVEGERVTFEIIDGSKGPAAESIRRGEAIEREEPEQPEQPEQLIALVEHEGRVRLVALAPDGTYTFLDESNRKYNLYIIDAQFLALADAVAELEYLINKSSVRESELQDFFERYPEFILNDEYKAAHPHLVLDNDKHGGLIPDFVLEPIGSNPLCDLLELKLPSARTYVLKKSRHRFSAAVMEAAAQLREYSAYFDDDDKRKRFSEQYGLTAFRPRMMVIIGRRGNVDPMVARRIQEDTPRLQIKSYDDLLDHMRTKVKRVTGRDI